MDDFTYSREWEPILYLADFVKLDYQALGRQGIARQAQHVRRPHLKLVAEKVETEEEFEICKALGFDYFQGYYFATRPCSGPATCRPPRCC